MYEYAVVQLPSVLKKDREIAWTEHINAVAAEGWRLVSLQSQDFTTGWTSGVATFERELPRGGLPVELPTEPAIQLPTESVIQL